MAISSKIYLTKNMLFLMLSVTPRLHPAPRQGRRDLQTLKERRNGLCFTFAKKCLKNNMAKHFFPLNSSKNDHTWNHKKFEVFHANTKRYQQSPIIFMQNLLNDNCS